MEVCMTPVEFAYFLDLTELSYRLIKDGYEVTTEGSGIVTYLWDGVMFCLNKGQPT